jgi:hypothetical protein
MGWGDSDSEEDEKLMEFFNTPLNNQGGEQLSSLDDGGSYTLVQHNRSKYRNNDDNHGRGRGGRGGHSSGRSSNDGRGRTSGYNRQYQDATDPFENDPPIPKPTFSEPKGKILQSLLKQEETTPIEMKKFAVFSLRERKVALMYIAAVRGRKHWKFQWKGSRSDLACKWQFESYEQLIELINDPDKMQMEVIKLNAMKRLPSQLNEGSPLFEFDKIIGMDTITRIGSAKTEKESINAMLHGVKLILCQMFGETTEVKNYYHGLESSADVTTLNNFFSKPRAFINHV